MHWQVVIVRPGTIARTGTPPGPLATSNAAAGDLIGNAVRVTIDGRNALPPA